MTDPEQELDRQILENVNRLFVDHINTEIRAKFFFDLLKDQDFLDQIINSPHLLLQILINKTSKHPDRPYVLTSEEDYKTLLAISAIFGEMVELGFSTETVLRMLEHFCMTKMGLLRFAYNG